VMKIILVLLSNNLSMSSMLSKADCCPTSGLAPAPNPSVRFTPY
jgi:hypothetical protein